MNATAAPGVAAPAGVLTRGDAAETPAPDQDVAATTGDPGAAVATETPAPDQDVAATTGDPGSAVAADGPAPDQDVAAHEPNSDIEVAPFGDHAAMDADVSVVSVEPVINIPVVPAESMLWERSLDTIFGVNGPPSSQLRVVSTPP